ncbi:Probable carbohydrate esterase, partial [Striga hermonthica]
HSRLTSQPRLAERVPQPRFKIVLARFLVQNIIRSRFTSQPRLAERVPQPRLEVQPRLKTGLSKKLFFFFFYDFFFFVFLFVSFSLQLSFILKITTTNITKLHTSICPTKRRKMHPLILILFFFCTGGQTLSNGTTTFTVLLAGQSNMAGRGGVEGGVWDLFVPPESLPAIPDSVIRLTPELKWEPAAEPLHRGIDTTVEQGHLGIGPGLPFATALLRRVDPSNTGAATVALVPAAMGGSNILQWQHGNNSYYLNLLARAECWVRYTAR